MKAGTEYELFVKDVYDTLLKEDGITVNIEIHKNIKGISGANHEIDLYWEFVHKGKTYKTSIECKDYSRKISKGLIAEYYGKLDDIPGLNGIIATKVGYQKGAKQFADHYKIQTLLVKVPTKEDFDENASLEVCVKLNTDCRVFQNINLELEYELSENKHFVGPKIKVNGETTRIKDIDRKFEGTINQFMQLDEIQEQITNNLNDGKAKVKIDFTNAFWIYGSIQSVYKIKTMSFEYKQSKTIKHINMDVIFFVKAIVKRVKDGDIIFVKRLFNGDSSI